MTEYEAMTRAIETCRNGILIGQSPFGAAILKGGELIAVAHNSVRSDPDPTAHAEVNAIRIAARALNTYNLAGCTLVSTCEPCPMCLAATHWANVDRLRFGASIADAESAGFREMPIAAETMVALGKSRLQVEGGLMVEECRALFEEWKHGGHAQAY